MAGNVVADAAEILILRREGGIVLVLPVDLAGEQVVARLQLASLGHAADGGEEQGVGRRADGQRQQQHQHAAQDEVRAQEDHPPVDQQILAGGKGEVQRPFAAGQAVLVAVHQQREQEHQKAVRREEDGVDRQLHGDGLERQALPELLRRQQPRDGQQVRGGHGHQPCEGAQERFIPLVAEQDDGREREGDKAEEHPLGVGVGHELRRDDVQQVADREAEQRKRPRKAAREHAAVHHCEDEVKNGIGGKRQGRQAHHGASLRNRCADHAGKSADHAPKIPEFSTFFYHTAKSGRMQEKSEMGGESACNLRWPG